MRHIETKSQNNLQVFFLYNFYGYTTKILPFGIYNVEKNQGSRTMDDTSFPHFHVHDTQKTYFYDFWSKSSLRGGTTIQVNEINFQFSLICWPLNGRR